jgi:hypothetical protein
MRYRSALLLAALCSVAAAQVQTEGKSLTVVLKTDHPAPAAVLYSMEREAEAAMAESDTALQWHVPRDGEHPLIAEKLALIRLTGECRPGAYLPFATPDDKAGNEPLGRTHVVDGDVLPIAEVRCDAVRRLIDRDLRAAGPVVEEDLLGRALGRVLAHELYHIVLHTVGHSAHGLTRSSQTSAELLAPRDIFKPREVRRTAASGGIEASGGAGGR